MAVRPELPQSALALITTADTYVLQDRPNLPGKLAYPGKLHFFGGGVNVGKETASEAVLRELCKEETNATPHVFSKPDLLWEGRYIGEDKRGEPVLRHIHLFGLEMAEDFLLQPAEGEGGDVLHIPQDVEVITILSEYNSLAPFAAEALKSHLLHAGAVYIAEPGPDA